jgi:16S rRNA processing protein RimM
MMEKRFLEAGQIVNTHGIKGEVKVQSWCDNPEFLLQFDYFHIGSEKVNVISKRIHSGMILVLFEGVDNIDKAIAMKNKVLLIDRALISLAHGQHFVTDLIGLEVFDLRTNNQIGILHDILHLPASDVYVVQNNSEQYLIPATGGFIENVDIGMGTITVNTIKGMLGEDDN